MRIRYFILFTAFSLVLQGVALSAEEKKSASEQEFCRLDKNNDREITFEEFKDCEFYKLENLKQLPYHEPQENSPKADTVLSEDEMKADLFKKADSKKDKKIDRKEWEEFYNSILETGTRSTPGRIHR